VNGDDEFLLPVSVATHDGYLFVVDLVSRSLQVFAEEPDGPRLLDTVSAFGGHPDEGAFWLPYLVSAADTGGEGVDLLVADRSVNVVNRYTWRP